MYIAVITDDVGAHTFAVCTHNAIQCVYVQITNACTNNKFKENCLVIVSITGWTEKNNVLYMYIYIYIYMHIYTYICIYIYICTPN